MKKIISVLLMIPVIVSLMAGAFAADDSRQYDFVLTCDGETSISAEKDSIVTVTLSLERIDSDEEAEISAFQTELCYDDEILEFVESRSELPDGVKAVDLRTDEFGRRLRISYVLGESDETDESDESGESSESNEASEPNESNASDESSASGESSESSEPNELFKQKTDIMSFDFKVLKEVGNTRLTQDSFLVSNENGTDTYKSIADEFLVVTEKYFIPEYSVVFEAMNGDAYDEVLIMQGEAVSEPETIPIRDGYEFSGWYTDSTLTELYDFAQPVESSMTLYAKWNELEKPFNTWILYAAAAPLLVGLILFIALRKRYKAKH